MTHRSKHAALALATLLALSLTAPAAQAAAEDGVFQTKLGKTDVTYNVETRSDATERWASTVKSYLIENADGTVSALRVSAGSSGYKIRVDTYSKALKLLDTKTVPGELSVFGGFLAGETYNYIAFGQSNMEEDDSKEVIRLVKYDKDFNRLGAAAVRACYTTEPFDAGARMAEHGNELVLHTSRQRYLTEDGLRHQSQLTVFFDTSSMAVTSKELGRSQPNHVSHSFNQFALYDGDRAVLLDHGDAYPRSVVLHRESGDERYDVMTMLEIPGETGANCTGVNVGGFALSDSAYLASVNTIDHSLAISYNAYSIEGVGQEERDAVILASDKKTGAVTATYLTHLVGTKRTAGAPKLVPLGDDRFLALWEIYSYEGYRYEGDALSYAVTDGTGALVSPVETVNGVLLSDCLPIVWDNCVTWFVDHDNGANGAKERTFYQIELTDEAERMIFTIDSKNVNVFGTDRTYDVAPTILHDRTMLPTRYVAENLGAAVEWDAAERKVTILGADGTEIVLYVDSATAYVNGEAVTLDSPAVILHDRTYTPVRFVAEHLGAQVRWFGGARQVFITK